MNASIEIGEGGELRVEPVRYPLGKIKIMWKGNWIYVSEDHVWPLVRGIAPYLTEDEWGELEKLCDDKRAAKKLVPFTGNSAGNLNEIGSQKP